MKSSEELTGNSQTNYIDLDQQQPKQQEKNQKNETKLQYNTNFDKIEKVRVLFNEQFNDIQKKKERQKQKGKMQQGDKLSLSLEDDIDLELQLKEKEKKLDEKNEKKFYQKKLIAWSYLNSGNISYSHLNDVFTKYDEELTIDSRHYKSLLNHFSTEVVRSLQRYIQVYCHTQVKPMDGPQARSFLKILANSRDLLYADLYSTLTDFLRFIFDIEKVSLSPKSMVQLHKRISELTRQAVLYKQHDIPPTKEKVEPMEQLIAPRAKNQIKAIKTQESKSFQQNQQVEQIWDEDSQQFLIKCYKYTQSFKQIYKLFCKEYPEYQDLWTAKILQSKFNIMIKQGLKRMVLKIRNLRQLKKIECQPLTSITNNRIKLILGCKNGRSLRFNILDFYMNKLKTGFKIVVQKINNLIQNEEKEKNREKADDQYVIKDDKKVFRDLKGRFVSKQRIHSFTYVEDPDSQN